MSRYVVMKSTGTTPVFWWDQVASPLPHPTAFPSEPARTGLVDKDGNEIYRAPDPIGFLAK